MNAQSYFERYLYDSKFLDIKMIGIDPRVGCQFGPKNIQNGTNNNFESEITFDNIDNYI